MVPDRDIITQAAYRLIAAGYAERDDVNLSPESHSTLAAIETFSCAMPTGGRVLDIGCGAGRDTRELTRHGYSVTSIDTSMAMLNQARLRDPLGKYVRMDMRQLDFAPQSFAGVWVNASLLHVSKNEAAVVLSTIYKALRPEGILFVRVKNGEDERFVEEEKFGSTIRRFFAFYRADELSHMIVKAGFVLPKITEAFAGKWLDALTSK
jgi:ubiquinone/menaquinone biosynthesis C-methylase UbiE